MSNQSLWEIYCNTENQYISVISNTAPSHCPNDPFHSINSSLTQVLSVQCLNLTSNNSINIQSNLSNSQALKLQAPATNGGIVMDSGSGGIYIGSTGGIQICSNGATTIIDGVSGICIGNANTNGTILFGSTGNHNIIIGSSTGTSRLGLRYGTNGLVKTQLAPTSLTNANATLTMSQLLTNIFTITPTLLTTLTIDTASNLVASLTFVQINDSIDFSIINLATLFGLTVAVGSGGTLVGSGSVGTSSTGTFRLRFTNVTSGSEAYSLYRIA